ncbi:LBP / BPI / CETP family protein [Oesophagostomum dentatum]|uniref:LBP / BPI / CETP family protein n=1 Tax=Oesophagostomum dentatum TaxID=61180 RepID=A0A0B1TIE7_OESDE|nr:LBP / BPI / CETP family protein [Oesophagostomum dentatum]
MTVALTAEFASTDDGLMSVQSLQKRVEEIIQVPNCSTIISGSHFNINPQGVMGPVVKTLEVTCPDLLYNMNFYGLINEGIRHRIPGMFCKKLKHLIEDNSPRLFKKLVRTEFEEHFQDFGLIDSPVIKKFVKDFVRGMYIDNRHIEDPVVTNEYFETHQRGEIRYKSNNEPTPFYPKLVKTLVPMYTGTESDRMLYFYGSDYLFNSLLYHAYQTNKLSIKDFVRGMYIDNRHIEDPVVTNEYFETHQRGEIRYKSNNEPTPFYPKLVKTHISPRQILINLLFRPMYTGTESDRMLYFYGSDYLFNSLLYHAYQTNKLSIKLDKNNLSQKYRGFVATTCSGGGIARDFTSLICVGKLIPAIAESYPNTTTSFMLLPHGLPDFQFNGDAGAIKLSTRILTYVDDHGHDKQIMVSSAEGQADILLAAQNGRLGGDLKLNRLSVRLHRSALPGMDPSSIEQLTPLAKTFIGPQLSQALKKGVPFPLKDSITFVEPQLQTRDGYIELATDFVLNENALRRKIRETFADIAI